MKLFKFIIAAFALGVVAAGCYNSGSDSLQTSPFDKYGGMKQQSVAPISFKILKPFDNSNYKPGDPIDCVLTIRTTDANQLPTILHIELLDISKPHVLQNVYPELLGRDGDVQFTYGVRLTAPSRSGHYRLRADGVDYVVREDGKGIAGKVDVVNDEIRIRVTEG